MMNQVYRTLPDDRPITSLCVVEDAEKCPKGYVVVSRTHDQDADADLWKDGGFFGRKCTRYLCLSKTEGTPDNVVQSILVINEKDTPPKGYSTINWTYDTSQKAWRKKQLCIKYAHVSSTTTAVTDIIILSRMKKAPEEFSLSGEINNMTICYKVGKSLIENGKQNNIPLIPYGLSPANQGNQDTSLNHNQSPNYQNIYPKPNLGENGMFNTDNLSPKPLVPRRPAPKPPATYATLSGYGCLEGVPFVLNPKWHFASESSKATCVIPKPKTRLEIDSEYSYEFRIERET